MELLIWSMLLGLIPAAIARNKGRSFFWFWVYGTLIFIIALPDTLLMRPNKKVLEKRAIASGGKKCPYCAEIVKQEAIVCRFCGRDFPESVSYVLNNPLSNQNKTDKDLEDKVKAISEKIKNNAMNT